MDGRASGPWPARRRRRPATAIGWSVPPSTIGRIPRLLCIKVPGPPGVRGSKAGDRARTGRAPRARFV